MKARLLSVQFPLLRSIVGLCISLSMPVPVFAGVASFTVDLHTVSDSSGTLVKGTVQCDAGHQTLVFGSVIQLVRGRLAQTVFNNFVNCDGTLQSWTSPLFNTSGVSLQPGRAAVNAFAVDFDDFTFGETINQMVMVKPAAP